MGHLVSKEMIEVIEKCSNMADDATHVLHLMEHIGSADKVMIRHWIQLIKELRDELIDLEHKFSAECDDG